MPLPDFIIIGSPKAGTTTLAKWVAGHPDVFFFAAKETHFFNFKFERGLEWYKSLFSQAKPGQLIGEATPDYTEGNTERTAKRIADAIPDAKLVFIVRHPIDRLESHYFQCIANGKPPVPFHRAVHEWPTLVETSEYFKIMEPFFTLFPAENIQIHFMEDLKTNEAALLQRLFAFLGLDKDRLELADVDRKIENARDTKAVDGALLGRLRKLKFFDDIKWLIPRPLVLKVKELLKKPVKLDDWPVNWAEVDAAEILRRLETDRRAFFDQIGESRDLWDISQDYLDRR